METQYNPLDKKNLGDSVAKALLEQGEISLETLAPFDGAGVYALYYIGDSHLYANYSSTASSSVRRPIYVGKAVPPGARKGGFGLGLASGAALFTRLLEHARSIEQVQNLSLSDFLCKYLVTDDIWIPLAESVLIARFQPVWNVFLDGFGNHDPGAGRRGQQRSPWDALHPGRPWSLHLVENAKPTASIEISVREFLQSKAGPARSATDAVLSEE